MRGKEEEEEVCGVRGGWRGRWGEGEGRGGGGVWCEGRKRRRRCVV